MGSLSAYCLGLHLCKLGGGLMEISMGDRVMHSLLRAVLYAIASVLLTSCVDSNPPLSTTMEKPGDAGPASTSVSRVVNSTQRDDSASTRPFAPNNELGFGTHGKSLAIDAPRQVRVFYATNRQLVPHPSGEGQAFGPGRNPRVAFGFADVSIPKEHRLGNIERPVIWRLELSETDKKHVVVKLVHQSEPAYFWRIFSDHAKSSPGRVLFFVHGFANTFDDAARRAAQMKYDLAFEGPVFFFSWPSNGTINPRHYPPDGANADWSVSDVARTLQDVVRRPEVKEVIIIAHSMGSKVLTQALAQPMHKSTNKVRELILAAPDIDRDVFVKDLMPRLKSLTSNTTIYTSQNDVALDLSRSFHNTARLGSSVPEMPRIDGAHFIDASAVDTGFGGHSYFADNRSIISDMYYLISQRLPPEKRATLERLPESGPSVWRFRQ